MTYQKAIDALVKAGLLDQAQVAPAEAVLASPQAEFSYPQWAQALAQAGLIDEADVDAAADVMQAAGEAEAEQDPDAFEQGFENAGLL